MMARIYIRSSLYCYNRQLNQYVQYSDLYFLRAREDTLASDAYLNRLEPRKCVLGSN